jgi:phosphoglycerate dehydrogenase-like enzyme
VQLTPHTCAISPQVQRALLDKVLQGLEAFERGDTPSDAVNLERGY